MANIDDWIIYHKEQNQDKTDWGAVTLASIFVFAVLLSAAALFAS